MRQRGVTFFCYLINEHGMTLAEVVWREPMYTVAQYADYITF